MHIHATAPAPLAHVHVLIVALRVKPVEAFAAPIDHHAHDACTLKDGCLAFDVRQHPEDPRRFVFYEADRAEAAHRPHLEMASYNWFRAEAPDLVSGSEARAAAPALRADAPPHLSE